jgi:hypothetical protein
MPSRRAPLGEPNRLYLFGPRWHWMQGLPDNQSLEETGEDRDGFHAALPAQDGQDGHLCQIVPIGQNGNVSGPSRHYVFFRPI